MDLLPVGGMSGRTARQALQRGAESRGELASLPLWLSGFGAAAEQRGEKSPHFAEKSFARTFAKPCWRRRAGRGFGDRLRWQRLGCRDFDLGRCAQRGYPVGVGRKRFGAKY